MAGYQRLLQAFCVISEQEYWHCTDKHDCTFAVEGLAVFQAGQVYKQTMGVMSRVPSGNIEIMLCDSGRIGSKSKWEVLTSPPVDTIFLIPKQ